MHDNEHHKPNLDALVSNAAQRRLQPSLTLEEIVSAPLTIAEHITLHLRSLRRAPVPGKI